MRISFRTMTSAFMALFVFFGLSLSARAETSFEKGTLSIITKTGERLEFQVEWALTAEQRARGLMERESLADNAGMLFDFGETRMVTMWMANTPLSLDMVFIDEAGLVVRVAEKTTPYSEAIVGSGKPVRYALEIRGGRAAELGLISGARLELPLALPAPKAP
jgi:uncharacterized membrane protein (UPF0127 family)